MERTDPIAADRDFLATSRELPRRIACCSSVLGTHDLGLEIGKHLSTPQRLPSFRMAGIV